MVRFLVLMKLKKRVVQPSTRYKNTRERMFHMQNHYNMNQLSLVIPTYYVLDKNHTAWYINKLVESLEINEP